MKRTAIACILALSCSVALSQVKPIGAREQIHHHFYTTRIGKNLPSGREDYYVYTPPGYDPASRTRYPVLYLLHGDTQSASYWLSQDHVARSLNAAIAEGKSQAMIVVMPAGYGDYRFFRGNFIIKWGNPANVQRNDALFSEMLLTEIIPRVQAEYRVSSKPEDRAIAGLSMGGREAISIGLSNPKNFDWIGGFSPAFPNSYSDTVGKIDPATKKLRLLWIGCGISDPYVRKGTTRVVAQLRQFGVPVTMVLTPGTHREPVWHDDFVRFAPLLFQAK